MKKALFILFFCKCILSATLQAQTLGVSTLQLTYGITYDQSPDSLPLTIYNTFSRDITVTGIRFYPIYGSPAFSSSQTWFSILPGDSAIIWIKFSPQHNIFHNTEMVIENNSLRGNISIDLKGQGKYSNSYYDPTDNLSEENLKSAIHTLTGNGYVSLLYNPARDAMFMQLDNMLVNGQGALQNTLECIYTGRLAAGYVDRTDCQNNFAFNTEHTFPQSFFSSLEPMKSDLHHLFPTDNIANNQRGDNPFGVVTSPSWSNGGSLSDGFTFEPRDVQKGPSARALFYFVLRYQNYNNFLNVQESILRTWHHVYPPGAIERKRNNDIYAVQNNRNPFVDYPVLLDRITSLSTTSVTSSTAIIDLPEDTIVYGTVNPGTPAIYNFVLENIGNTDIHFTNFNLTHSTELSFSQGGNDTVIVPGESLTLYIRCLTTVTDSIRAFLTFNTDATGASFLSIPVFVNDLIYSGLKEIKNEVVVFPNPAKDYFTISMSRFRGNEIAELTDMTGRKILSMHIKSNNQLIPCGQLPPGIYFLKLFSEQELLQKRIVIE